MTKIKICGITREIDAQHAIAAGADSLGFVFYPKSKRAVTPQQLTWLHRLPPFVTFTALFVNPSHHEVNEVIRQLPINLLQFHGNESAEFCEHFDLPYIKAVPMQDLSASESLRYMASHPNAIGFLLDNYGKAEMGGSGRAFNWEKIPTTTPAPLIMAGGLHSDNVAEVIQHTHPYAVDVSSGVESSAGIKCIEKMQAFVSAVRKAS